MAMMMVAALVLAASSVTSCAGRQPSVKKAERLTSSYFKRYGRKYKETVFGQHPVASVDLHHMEEFHKNYVHADAVVTLQDALRSRVRVAIEKKLPGGWRIVAWELVGR